ncbi:peptidase M24 [Caballeronia arvi]|uniref:Peptidase M24 n=1 Tax=Caballeronia arvi TaxID=1777135 RepID=A0A158KVU6_9BURK|nr:Xaa-Pro peptidase family protein [Caballeronia arvi]SAL85296.1 peptidase M24 [Caballeronia arvi]
MVVPQFSSDEFVSRLAKIREAMKERALDVVIVDDIEIVAYFTGYERSISSYRACLLPLNGEPVMVLRSLDVAPFRESSWFSNSVGYIDGEDAVELVAKTLILHGHEKARIGVDKKSHGMTVSTFETLTRMLPGATFVDLAGLPWDLRLVKSALEVQHIQAAAAIADETLNGIFKIAKPGITERMASAFAARRYIELGALPDHVGPVTAGRGWDFLHGHLHDNPLQEGDVLHCELVPRFRGYSGRLMRSIIIGRASVEQREVANTLVRLQDKQFAMMKPGAKASDVDAVLRQGVVDSRLRETYDNITGYTLGFYSQQPIRSSDFTRTFSPKSDWLLEAGMVFHMYTSARGIAFSESVVIEKDCARRLTRLPRALFETAEGYPDDFRSEG